MSRTICLVLILLALAITPDMIRAADETRPESKELKPIEVWKGSIEDRSILGKPPTVIASTKTWKAHWDAWKLADKLPEVDFAKQIVIVQTTVGSQIHPRLTLNEQGDLRVISIATKDLRPGFRYVMMSVSRDGVKSINGQKLGDENVEEDKATVSGNVIGPEGDLEAGLVVTIRLQDVSLQDAAAKILGEQIIRDPKAFPVPFSIAYDPANVSDSGLMYSIGVRVEKNGELRYINDTRISVISNGSPTQDIKAPVIEIRPRN